MGIKDGMNDGPFSIETIARIPASNISFESLLDFETIVTKQKMTKQLLIKNIGTKPGHFQLEIPEKHKQEIEIRPSAEDQNGNGNGNGYELDVNAMMKLDIKLTAPNKLGIFVV